QSRQPMIVACDRTFRSFKREWSVVGGAGVCGPGPGPGPPTSVHSFLLREPMEMVRTHLPGACRNVGAAFEDAPRRARQRAAVWAGVVSLFLAGPTFAGGT